MARGFSVQEAAPFGADDDTAIANIEQVMTQAQQNWVQYGDTAYFRVLTRQALRVALQPAVRLTGQPVELCPETTCRSASGRIPE